MTGSFRNIIRIGDTSGPEPVENQILSIGFRPDGFVFSVLDADNFTYLKLEDIQIDSDGYNERYLADIRQFLNENALLKAPFQKTHISLFTPNLLLIPAALYTENEKETIYRFCNKLPDNYLIQSEKLHILDAFGLYSFPREMKRFFDDSFDNYRFRHQGTVLIESALAANQLENWQVDVVLHIKRTFFEIILMEDQKIILYQSFEYVTFDDLLYYLFYVLEQFDRHAAYQKLLLIGEISMDCEAYQTLASLFLKVFFPERNDAYQYTDAFDQIPGQYYYNLLSLVTCG